MPDRPWYESISADTAITQGDLIFNCPVLSWKGENLVLEGADETEVLKGSAIAVSADVVVMAAPAIDQDAGYWMLDTGLTRYSVDFINRRRATRGASACAARATPFSSIQ